MPECKREAELAGRPAPRTCPGCPLAGPCAKGLESPLPEAERDRLTAYTAFFSAHPKAWLDFQHWHANRGQA